MQDASGAVPLASADPVADQVTTAPAQRASRPRDNTSGRWIGWRSRLLAVLALSGCVGLFLLANLLAAGPSLHAQWRADAEGRVMLAGANDPLLLPLSGRVLVSIEAGTIRPVTIGALALHSSSRWLASAERRAAFAALHEQLAAVLATPRVRLVFNDGAQVDVEPGKRGLSKLGSAFWLLGALALALALVSMAVLLARPSLRNLLYAVMSICQAGNLMLMAIGSTLELALPAGYARWDLPARSAFDLLTASAIVHAAALHPRRLPHAAAIAAAGWAIAAVLIGFAFAAPHDAWWLTQAGVLGNAVAATGLFAWSYRQEPHPFADLLRRIGIAGTVAFAMLSAAVAAAEPSSWGQLATFAPLVWSLCFAAMLLMLPFLSRSQQLMREFALLAAVSTVATALDLLFVVVFSFGQFASLTLALFLALGAYAGARQWIVDRIRGSSVLTTERMFDRLYRIARAVEARPAHTARLLAELLRDLFEPLEATVIAKTTPRAVVVAEGSTLLVPVPAHASFGEPLVAQTIMARYAGRGRRLFTAEDARLAERVVEQLQRAIAFDRAVEQGRSEERLRLAQDLHDDIGARLLTLMYKAESPEVEDYVRHTLQDLKTLTRGLAAPNHLLSHAAAEWKTDLTQRLGLAQCELRWSINVDDDLTLTVVQWSALTRVLRELASNVIAHANATEVDVALHLQRDRLDLSVIDDGNGRNPQAWSHGLGLSGVRKRVKQLGGDVQWFDVEPRGIGCRVRIEEFSGRREE